MSRKMSRRDALKLSTNIAVSAAVTPLLASANQHSASERMPKQAMANQHRPSASDICFLRAVDMIDLLRQKKISSREIMQAHLKQIARVNPQVNAMVTMVPEDKLMAQAAAADEALAHGKW